jgi:hypothetical protein
MPAGTLKDMPDVLSPEDMLASAIVVWFDEMLKSYVNEPGAEESLLLVLRSNAIALRRIADRFRNGTAMLDHFKANL